MSLTFGSIFIFRRFPAHVAAQRGFDINLQLICVQGKKQGFTFSLCYFRIHNTIESLQSGLCHRNSQSKASRAAALLSKLRSRAQSQVTRWRAVAQLRSLQAEGWTDGGTDGQIEREIDRYRERLIDTVQIDRYTRIYSFFSNQSVAEIAG